MSDLAWNLLDFYLTSFLVLLFLVLPVYYWLIPDSWLQPNKWRQWFMFFFVCSVLDSLTTYFLAMDDWAGESNPAMRYLFYKIGFGATLFIYKGIFTFFFYLTMKHLSHRRDWRMAFHFLTIGYVVVIANNFHQIFIALTL